MDYRISADIGDGVTRHMFSSGVTVDVFPHEVPAQPTTTPSRTPHGEITTKKENHTHENHISN